VKSESTVKEVKKEIKKHRTERGFDIRQNSGLQGEKKGRRHGAFQRGVGSRRPEQRRGGKNQKKRPKKNYQRT